MILHMPPPARPFFSAKHWMIGKIGTLLEQFTDFLLQKEVQLALHAKEENKFFLRKPRGMFRNHCVQRHNAGSCTEKPMFGMGRSLVKEKMAKRPFDLK